MAYLITDDCAMCGLCATQCPNAAISEGEYTFVIDSERCTECVGFTTSPRCVTECPNDAVVPDPRNS